MLISMQRHFGGNLARPSRVLKLGPEILTRDLNQAKKKVEVRCKKKKKSMHFSPPQASAEILGDRKRTIVFVLFSSDFECVA